VSSQLYGHLWVLSIMLNMAKCFVRIGRVRYQTDTKVYNNGGYTLFCHMIKLN